MNTYEANDDLANLILLNGWVEDFNDNRLVKKPGKRVFRKSLKSKFNIYFDYINIQIFDGYNYYLSTYKLNELDLTCLMNYCNNSSLRHKLEERNFVFGNNSFTNFIENSKKNIEFYNRFENGKSYAEKLNKIVMDLTKPILLKK